MNPIPRLFLIAAILVAMATPTLAADWRPLFNGNYDGWRTWLGVPHESVDVPGMQRGADGKYASPLGWDSDPLQVFTLADVDGRPAMRFSGQVFGVIVSDESFSNYHLRLQFKWGEKRWAPRAEAVRDSGLLYHVHGEQGRSSRTWPASVEMQIQEHDCGDLWAIVTQVSVRARTQPGENNRTLYTYDPAGEAFDFEQKLPINNRCIKGGDFEKPTGEWNTIEMVSLGGDSIHIVNGHVVMRLGNARQQAGDGWAALTAGRIALQSEGAEIFYRDIEIRPITGVPPEYAEK